MSFGVAVLCGGASRRMGRDKALLEVQGETMAQRVARAARAAGSAEIVAVGGDGPGLVAAGLRHVPDRWPHEGPLGGLLTALEALPQPVVLVVACDLAQPSPAAMVATVDTLSGRPDADVALPVPVPGGVPAAQWMHGAWRRTALAPLREPFDVGERAVHRAVDAAGLVVAEVAGLDPASLADVDRPGDLPS